MASLYPSRRFIAPVLASAVFALLAALPVAHAATTSDDPVVAQISGKAYHLADLKKLLARLQQQNQQLQGLSADDPNIYPRLLREFVTGRLVLDAAEKAKLDRDAEFKKQLSDARATLLQNYYAETVIRQAATPEAAKALYAKKVAKNEVPIELHVRHILVTNEADAKAVVDQLDKGGDFVKIAHDKSIDTTNAGGDLGWLTAQQMLPEMSQAAFILKKGEYTKSAVHTKFGWHVIQVTDTRPAPYEDIRNELGNELAQQALRERLKQLRTSAKVSLFGLDGKPVVDPAQ